MENELILNTYQLIIIEIIKNKISKYYSINNVLNNIKLSNYLDNIDIEMKNRIKGKKTSLGSTHGLNINYVLNKNEYNETIIANRLFNIVYNAKIIYNNKPKIIFNSKKDKNVFLIYMKGKPINSAIYDQGLLKKSFLKHYNKNNKIKYKQNIANILHGLEKNSNIFKYKKEFIYLNKSYINTNDYFNFKLNKFNSFDFIKIKLNKNVFLNYLKKYFNKEYIELLYNMEKKYLKLINKYNKEII